MPLMTVVVPDGLTEGMDFVVAGPGGLEYSVTVPSGVAGNVAIEVDLPDAPPPAAADTQRVAVAVPDGLLPGDPFNVEAAWGGIFEVCVPDGVGGGDTIEVELPMPPPEPPAAAADGEWDDWQPPCGSHTVGQKIKVQRTNGSWSPAKIVEYDYVSDTYTIKLELTGQLKYMVSDSEIQPMSYMAERAGEHFIGRRVQVPCVGAESRDEVYGEIRSYDEEYETYVVALDCGVVKRNLTADEIKVREKGVGQSGLKALPPGRSCGGGVGGSAGGSAGGSGRR